MRLRPAYRIERLKALSENTRVPQSEYLRDAVELILATHEKKKEEAA